MNPPTVSVIIPARNCEDQLERCLLCLERSSYKDYEVIVVDDASTDTTPNAAKGENVRLVKLDTQHGPALARNRGADMAQGDFLIFLDADVCVQPDTLALFVDTFAQDSKIDAVFGSYDIQPFALNIISQYRNLMHHFVHQEAKEEASTFWSGCGAVRRNVFLKLGGFSESFGRPCIEDIELGVRLRAQGYRIVLNKQIQVCHLKKWTLWGMVKTDVRDRAFPWTQLILRERNVPNDLNLKMSQRLSALLSFALVVTLFIAACRFPTLFIVPVVLLVGVKLLDAWSLTRRVPTSWRILAVVAIVAGYALIWLHFQAFAAIPLALLIGIVALNWRFYLFFARTRGVLFAAVVLPLHVGYYLYSAATFVAALFLHFFRRRKTESVPRPTLKLSDCPIVETNVNVPV